MSEMRSAHVLLALGVAGVVAYVATVGVPVFHLGNAVQADALTQSQVTPERDGQQASPRMEDVQRQSMYAAEPSHSREGIPDAAKLAILIRTTVIAVNHANFTNNYSVLREAAAPGFREANSQEKLSEIFAGLRARNLDLSPVSVLNPQLFRQPALDGSGRLRLTGFFPSRPEQVNFDLAYEMVDGRWRLFGIGLNTSREELAGQ